MAMLKRPFSYERISPSSVHIQIRPLLSAKAPDIRLLAIAGVLLRLNTVNRAPSKRTSPS
jgi:hypothetical protein